MSRSTENTSSLRLLERLAVGIDRRTRPPLFGKQHYTLTGTGELADISAPNVLVLDQQHPGLGPLAVGPELHLTDDGIEFMGADVLADGLLIQALGRLDGLAQDLHHGVGPGRQ